MTKEDEIDPIAEHGSRYLVKAVKQSSESSRQEIIDNLKEMRET